MPEWKDLGPFGRGLVVGLLGTAGITIGLYLLGIYPSKIVGVVPIIGVFVALLISVWAIPDSGGRSPPGPV